MVKKIKGMFFIALLSLMLVFIPAEVNAETISGECGESLTWTLDKERRTLRIDGDGEMYDFDLPSYSSLEPEKESKENNPPWEEYKNDFDLLYVSTGCKRIGNAAFSNCDSLERIRLDDVTEIGESAFLDCDSLEGIGLRNGTKIGKSAFSNCDSLEEIILWKETEIGESAFSDCDKLNKVTIKGNSKDLIIGMNAFSNCRELKQIQLEDRSINIGGEELINKMLVLNKKGYDFAVENGYDYLIDSSAIECYTYSPKSYEYTGKEIKPGPEYIDVLFSFNGEKLVYQKDYEISYENNIERGTATMIITLKGNYRGTRQCYFRIVEPEKVIYRYIANLVNCQVDSVNNQVYTGKEIKPKVIVRYKNTILKEGRDYNVSYQNNIKVGTAIVEITSAGGEYGGETTAYFNIVPPKTTGLKSTNQTTSSVTLNWAKTPESTNYEIYKYNDSSKKWEKVGSTAQTSYEVKKLKEGTKYKFKVRAYKTISGKAYYGSYSEGIQSTTKVSNPSKVKGLKAKKQTTTSVTLNWSKATGATGYEIYKYNTSKKKWEKVGSTTKTSYEVKKLKEGTKYKFKVRAYKTVSGKKYYGLYSEGIQSTTKVSNPSKVKGLKAKKQTTTSVTLNWSKATGATGYEVYKYNSSKKKWEKVGSTTKTSYEAKKLKEGTSYKFKVRAYKTVSGKKYYGSYSEGIQSTTKVSNPSKVKGLKAKKQTTTSVTLNWSKATGATGYEIYKYNTSKKKWEKVGSTTKTSYEAKKLKAGTKYKFKVKAYKTVNKKKYYGSYSSELSVTTTRKTTTTSSSKVVSNGKSVYRTPSGKRYHYDPDCGGKNSYKTTLSSAQSSGLTPCKKCAY